MAIAVAIDPIKMFARLLPTKIVERTRTAASTHDLTVSRHGPRPRGSFAPDARPGSDRRLAAGEEHASAQAEQNYEHPEGIGVGHRAASDCLTPTPRDATAAPHAPCPGGDRARERCRATRLPGRRRERAASGPTICTARTGPAGSSRCPGSWARVEQLQGALHLRDHASGHRPIPRRPPSFGHGQPGNDRPRVRGVTEHPTRRRDEKEVPGTERGGQRGRDRVCVDVEDLGRGAGSGGQFDPRAD